MKAMVTGATGQIGHQLALRLASEDYSVHILVGNPYSEAVPNHKNIAVFHGDLCDYESICSVMEGCTYVFHTESYANLKCRNIDNFYRGNVIGTQNVLQAALDLKVNKVIYTSALEVFGPSYKKVPITETQPRLAAYANDFELTKSMSEEVVFDFVKKGLSCVILNLTKVYGPGINPFLNGVNRLMATIANKDLLIVPSKLDVVSNYVYIEDAIEAHMLAISYAKSGERYIIGGENMDYNELFQNIKVQTRSRVKILKVNYRLFKMAIRFTTLVNWLFGMGSAITPKLLDSLFTNRRSSSEKAMVMLNYKITPFNIAFAKTFNCLKPSK